MNNEVVERKGRVIEIRIPVYQQIVFLSKGEMNELDRKINIKTIQAVGILVIYLLNVLYLLPVTTVGRAFFNPIVPTFFNLTIIYVNVLWLIPRLYERRKYVQYVLTLLLFYGMMVILQLVASHLIFNTLLGDQLYDYSIRQIRYFSFSTFLILTVSVLLYMTLRYFSLLKEKSDIDAQRYRAELGQLKAQVQPHFLFNTLNNIYYEAYRESPRAAELIEKLSSMMRYFVEESPREMVPLTTELDFLKSYIELEKIRMRYQLEVNVIWPSANNVMIPPMLLIPLVENIFKHGIDKRRESNPIALQFGTDNGKLMFKTSNQIVNKKQKLAGGFGLRNLNQRLQLLYRDEYLLTTSSDGAVFNAELVIPLK
jgi:sensor histidine kinase YesM